MTLGAAAPLHGLDGLAICPLFEALFRPFRPRAPVYDPNMFLCARHCNGKNNSLLSLVGWAQLCLLTLMTVWLSYLWCDWVQGHANWNLDFFAKLALLVGLQILSAKLIDAQRAKHIAECSAGWPLVIRAIDLSRVVSRSIRRRLFDPITFIHLARASGTLSDADLPPPAS